MLTRICEINPSPAPVRLPSHNAMPAFQPHSLKSLDGQPTSNEIQCCLFPVPPAPLPRNPISAFSAFFGKSTSDGTLLEANKGESESSGRAAPQFTPPLPKPGAKHQTQTPHLRRSFCSRVPRPVACKTRSPPTAPFRRRHICVTIKVEQCPKGIVKKSERHTAQRSGEMLHLHPNT